MASRDVNRSRSILTLLAEGPLTTPAAAERLGTTASALSGTLADLKRRGSIRSIAASGRGRGNWATYAITDKGREHLSGMTDQSWRPEQIAAIREHFPAPDEILARIVSELGPVRTTDAVMEQRRRMGLKRPSGGTLAQSRAANERAAGWPTPKGDKAFLVALYEALKPSRREAA